MAYLIHNTMDLADPALDLTPETIDKFREAAEALDSSLGCGGGLAYDALETCIRARLLWAERDRRRTG